MGPTCVYTSLKLKLVTSKQHGLSRVLKDSHGHAWGRLLLSPTQGIPGLFKGQVLSVQGRGYACSVLLKFLYLGTIIYKGKQEAKYSDGGSK